MKIALIGTHSTGKTTIIKNLAQELNAIGKKTLLVPELARFCPMPINEEAPLEAQIWIQENQRQKEDELYEADSILLCDRSTLDNFAYMQRVANNADIHQFENLAVSHMNSYTLVFKTQKLDLAAKADGVRSVDESFRDEIDLKISNLLNKHRIYYYPLPPTIDYKVHVDFILKKIEQTAPQCVLPIKLQNRP
ncbi:ATP-binding protein [Patescibacteria group bacterium]|nr:ATP-binding protein [Patescibacteria group bacterium]MBU1895947.1 ATP-binding protein [Patescibacteria group bacterium]